MSDRLDVSTLITGYAEGCFPMAAGRDGEVAWYRPTRRAVLPVDDRFHVPRRLGKVLRSGRYRITFDTAFAEVVSCCSAPRRNAARGDHGETWISREIERAYAELHAAGFAVSVEAWADAAAFDAGRVGEGPSGPIEPVRRGNAVLAGGLYAVTLGRAVFAESMFSRGRDASGVCLVALVERCRAAGVTLLDIQMDSTHLRRFGAEPIGQRAFMARLEKALGIDEAEGAEDE